MTENTATHRLTLAGALTLRRADELCAALREAITHHADLQIDCSDAAETDLTFVQLLLAARVSAAAVGGRVGLSAPPAGPLAETLARAGFAPVAGPADSHWFAGASA